MFICCECCLLTGRDLCDELITRPEESYRLCCVVVCDLQTSWMRRSWPTGGWGGGGGGGCCAKRKKKKRCQLRILNTIRKVAKLTVLCFATDTDSWNVTPHTCRCFKVTCCFLHRWRWLSGQVLFKCWYISTTLHRHRRENLKAVIPGSSLTYLKGIAYECE